MTITYRKDIDGLRAIAVLSVLIFHAFPHFLKGGYVGVDIFFVISGFLISGIILQQHHQKNFSWKNFYMKRIKRIFPSLILFLSFLIIIGFFCLFSAEYQLLGKHILMSSLFSNNFLLFTEAGYFDISSHFKPLLHLWSLGIEEQFYIIWPIVIYLCFRYNQSVFISMSLISIISFLINMIYIKESSQAVFYLPLSRIWELSIGGLTAFLYQKFSTLHLENSRRNLFSMLAICMMFFSIIHLNQSILYPSWYALIPTLATAILIFFQQSFIHRYLLENSLLRMIGLISYPLYLWHWGLLSLAHIFYEGSIPHPVILIIILLSFTLSYISYRFIEIPIRKNHHPEFEKNITILLSFLMLLIGATGLYIYQHQGISQRGFNIKQETHLKDINHFFSYQKQNYNCKISAFKYFPEICLQNKNGNPEFLIWGDSHAEHLFPGLVKKDHQKHIWRLEKTSNCPPLLGVRAHWLGEKDRCYKTNLNVIKRLKNYKSIHTVVLSSLALFYLYDTGVAFEHQGKNSPNNFKLEMAHAPTDPINKRGVFQIGYEKTIESLHQMGKHIIIIQDIPELPFMPNQCIDRPFFHQHYPCKLSYPLIRQQQNEYHHLLLNLQKKYPYIQIYNTPQELCSNKECDLKRNGHLIYSKRLISHI
jgi:peptidoglycan/LPS O-acetylase OafA/YrhL